MKRIILLFALLVGTSIVCGAQNEYDDSIYAKEKATNQLSATDTYAPHLALDKKFEVGIGGGLLGGDLVTTFAVHGGYNFNPRLSACADFAFERNQEEYLATLYYNIGLIPSTSGGVFIAAGVTAGADVFHPNDALIRAFAGPSLSIKLFISHNIAIVARASYNVFDRIDYHYYYQVPVSAAGLLVFCFKKIYCLYMRDIAARQVGVMMQL